MQFILRDKNMSDYYELDHVRLPDCPNLKCVLGKNICQQSGHEKTIEFCENCIASKIKADEFIKAETIQNEIKL
jgi:hypothetical protein